MANIEDIEIEKRRQQLDREVGHLVDKYLKIFEWEVPDVDEKIARDRIIDAIRQSLTRIQAGS